MRLHDLKIWPEHYEAKIKHGKSYELRKNDRGFSVGDALLLREWSPKHKRYTGRRLFVPEITHVLTHDDATGISVGYCILSCRGWSFAHAEAIPC